jgi:hypothetical protein
MEGHDVAVLQVHRVYDLNAAVAEYLIVAGYAIVEMRAVDRPDNPQIAADAPPSTKRRP